MYKWIWNKEEIDTNDFLANDDIRFSYHLTRWKEDGPKPLSILCKRFLNRDLLKALDIQKLSNEKQLEGLSIARKLCERNGEDPDISCGLRKQKIDGYKPYKEGLRIWDKKTLSAIESSSELIKGLINPNESAWLIYPKNIHRFLNEEINILIESSIRGC